MGRRRGPGLGQRGLLAQYLLWASPLSSHPTDEDAICADTR
jgi:hypothetical protein